MIRSQATCGDFLDNRSAYLHHCYLNGIPGSSWSQRPSILHLQNSYPSNALLNVE